MGATAIIGGAVLGAAVDSSHPLEGAIIGGGLGYLGGDLFGGAAAADTTVAADAGFGGVAAADAFGPTAAGMGSGIADIGIGGTYGVADASLGLGAAGSIGALGAADAAGFGAFGADAGAFGADAFAASAAGDASMFGAAAPALGSGMADVGGIAASASAPASTLMAASAPGALAPAAGFGASAGGMATAGAAAAGSAGFGSSVLPMLNLAGAGLMLTGGMQMSKMAKADAQPTNAMTPYQPQLASKTMDLINNPSSVKQTPGYQFQLDAGEEAVRRKMYASGYGGSGNEAIALNDYAQNYASNQYQTQLQNLSGLAMASPGGNSGAAMQGLMGGYGMYAGALNQLGQAAAYNPNSANTGGAGY